MDEQLRTFPLFLFLFCFSRPHYKIKQRPNKKQQFSPLTDNSKAWKNGVQIRDFLEERRKRSPQKFSLSVDDLQFRGGQYDIKGLLDGA